MSAVDFTTNSDPGDEQPARCGNCGSPHVMGDRDICNACWDDFDNYYRLIWDGSNYAEMEDH